MKDAAARREALWTLCDKIATLSFNHRYALHQIYTNSRKAERIGKELEVLRALRREQFGDLTISKPRKTRKRK